jgi:hypothetical protein
VREEYDRTVQRVTLAVLGFILAIFLFLSRSSNLVPFPPSFIRAFPIRLIRRTPYLVRPGVIAMPAG